MKEPVKGTKDVKMSSQYVTVLIIEDVCCTHADWTGKHEGQ